jgi:hypothetical protein
VSSRHYDVVVLGRSLGALTAAALLARRDFRVLLLGQGQKPPSYEFEGKRFKRRAFTFLAGSSPVWKRVLQELAQSPRFRRRTVALDPMFSVLGPGRRLEVPPDIELFGREVEREYPEVRQLVDELYATFAHVNAAADAAFERDAVWPPGSLWEAFETRRAASTLPYTSSDRAADLLAKFPPGHPFRDLVTLPTLFATDLASSTGRLPPFALARLHGAWTRGIVSLADAEDELASFLIDRVEAHGGAVRLNHRATRIVVHRGRVTGVLEDGEEEPTGTTALITDLSGEHVADLAGGDGVTRRAQREWPRIVATSGRFVVSLLVRTLALPEPLGQENFIIGPRGALPDPRSPSLHVQRLSEPETPESLLVVETLLPMRGTLTALEARDAVLSTLCTHLPWLEPHLLAVDSPHDGLPLFLYENGRRREIDRIHVQETTPTPEPMRWQWSVEPNGFLELAGEPIRGPIPGTYLVGSSVLPALGQEGQLLAAWGAARIVTRQDGARQRMRRQMWTKIEMG